MTSSDLSVNFMQQESLLELKACIDTESSESDSYVLSLFVMATSMLIPDK